MHGTAKRVAEQFATKLLEEGIMPVHQQVAAEALNVRKFGSFESPAALESRGFDITCFESELSAAENAVLAMTD